MFRIYCFIVIILSVCGCDLHIAYQWTQKVVFPHAKLTDRDLGLKNNISKHYLSLQASLFRQ